MSNTHKFVAIVHPAEEGGYWAEVPIFPGCISEGDTLDEVKANIAEAAEAWLETKNAQAKAKIKQLQAGNEKGVRSMAVAF